MVTEERVLAVPDGGKLGGEKAAEIRRELQELGTRERDLLFGVGSAVAGRNYQFLRDLADKLVNVSGRQAELRQAQANVPGSGPKREPANQSDLRPAVVSHQDPASPGSRDDPPSIAPSGVASLY